MVCVFRFGVCCLFLISTTGTNINQNCTYLRNPGFPSTYSGTGSLSYTVTKCSSGKYLCNNTLHILDIYRPSQTGAFYVVVYYVQMYVRLCLRLEIESG
jgi:hypothetical protein